MMNLDKMTKQLDALTYNSRSVLNAMVRSAMKSGSANGFTVTRGGEKIVLTRTDIYRLYAFYQDWEYKISYATDTTFDELLAEHDAKYIGDYQGSSKSSTSSSATPTTDAVVKHAKIMYQTDENKDSDTSYWLGLVKESTNAKLLTNTAPIPINIRTPIYDENLSTKHFDQLETYLFPIAYNSLDILGYGGDGVDHLAGGKDWIFDVDSKFTVNAESAVFGVQNTEISNIRNSNKIGTSPLHSVSYGIDCYNSNNNSISGGLYNQTVGLNSLAIGGERNIAYDNSCAVVGGYSSSAVGNYSAVIAGNQCYVGSSLSLASGNRANAGGYAYYFQRYLSSKSEVKETTCQSSYIDPNGCEYVLKLDSDGTSSSASRSLTNTQVYITEDSRNESVIGSNKISAGDTNSSYSAFDFKVGDTVKLFNYGTLSDSIVNAGVEITATVEGIEQYNDGYIITLDKDVTSPIGFVGTVAYGRIMRFQITAYPVINSIGDLSTNSSFGCNGSVALNYNTIAAGYGQTVVGTSNSELIRPAFIVGNGCSYINGSAYRSNGLVVAPNYTYMKTNTNYIGFGVSNYGTAYTDRFGNSGDEEDLSKRRYDEDYMDGIYKFTGVYAYSLDGNMVDHAVMRTHYQRSELTINDNGIRIYQPYQYGYGNNVNVLVGSKNGAVVIHAGDDGETVSANSEDVTWDAFYANKMSGSSDDDKSLLLWSSDDVAMKGRNAKIYASENLDVDFGTITICGDTYGTLVNAVNGEYCVPHNIQDHGIIYPNTVADTGFYYGKLNVATDDGRYVLPPHAFTVPDNVHTLHVINSTVKTDTTYDVAQLIMPGAVDTSSSKTVPHIMFVTNPISGRGNNDVDPTQANDGNVIAEEIAYMSDISNTSKQVFNVMKPSNPYIPDSFSDDSKETGDVFIYVDSDESTRMSKCDFFENAVVTNNNFYSSSASNVKFINVSSFRTAYGSAMAAIVDSTYFTYFLNGVGINPGYQARFFNTNNGSSSYQGFAFIGVSDSSLADYRWIPTNYADKVKTAAVTRSIMTSPHSRSLLSPIDEKKDLCTIWATMINCTGKDEYVLQWCKIASNVQVAYNNGNVIVEFDFYPSISTTYLSSGRARAFTLSNNTTTIVDPESSVECGGTDSASDETSYFTSITFPIPLGEDFASHITALKNEQTGIQHDLYGTMYSTGSDNVSVHGSISDTAPVYNHDDSRNAYREYDEPVIQISIDGYESLKKNTAYHVKLEGAATYVD